MGAMYNNYPLNPKGQGIIIYMIILVVIDLNLFENNVRL